MQGVISSDVVVHMPGRNSLAGDYEGSGEVIALAARAAAFFEPGALRILGIEAVEGEIVGRVRLSGGYLATRRDFLFIRMRMHVTDDKVTEGWIEPDDQKEWDEFVGRALDQEE